MHIKSRRKKVQSFSFVIKTLNKLVRSDRIIFKGEAMSRGRPMTGSSKRG